MDTFVRPISEASEQDAIRGFMQKVYTWMTGGLVLTGVVAFEVANSPDILKFVFATPGVFFGLIIAEFALVLGMSFMMQRLSAFAVGTMFVAYSALNGLTLSVIFLAYAAQSITQVFFITAGMFAGMSVYGLATKKDLTSWGSFFMMGLWGIILCMLVNLFLRSPAISYAMSFIGVFVFLGLTAYDTQKLKHIAIANPHETNASEKSAIYGALTLYLDFINLFLMLLRLLGRRR